MENGKLVGSATFPLFECTRQPFEIADGNWKVPYALKPLCFNIRVDSHQGTRDGANRIGVTSAIENGLKGAVKITKVFQPGVERDGYGMIRVTLHSTIQPNLLSILGYRQLPVVAG